MSEADVQALIDATLGDSNAHDHTITIDPTTGVITITQVYADARPDTAYPVQPAIPSVAYTVGPGAADPAASATTHRAQARQWFVTDGPTGEEMWVILKDTGGTNDQWHQIA